MASSLPHTARMLSSASVSAVGLDDRGDDDLRSLSSLTTVKATNVVSPLARIVMSEGGSEEQELAALEENLAAVERALQQAIAGHERMIRREENREVPDQGRLAQLQQSLANLQQSLANQQQERNVFLLSPV
jgi:hypothetical protein